MSSVSPLATHPDIRPLLADPRPAWIWGTGGNKILWCNASAAAVFNLKNLDACLDKRFSSRSPAATQIARVATQGQDQPANVELLRFQFGVRSIALPCLCQHVEIDGREGVLVIGTNAAPRQPSDLASLAKAARDYSGFDPSQTAVVDGQGNVLIGDPPASLAGPEALAGLLDGSDGQDAIEADGSRWQVTATAIDLSGTPAAFISWQKSAIEVAAAVLPVAGGSAAIVTDQANTAPTPDNETPSDEADPQPTDELHETKPDDNPTPSEAETESTDNAPHTPDTEPESSDEPRAPVEDQIPPEEPAPPAPAELLEVDEATEEPEAKITDIAPTEVSPSDRSDADIEPPAPPPEPAATGFSPRVQPYRFVWQMDAELNFTSVSEGLAEAVGTANAELTGRKWAEVADTYDLDPHETISDHLERGDTWSGVTVNWPVAGADIQVPVDLAALPTFDRQRTFTGYKGFGVCRTNDFFAARRAEADPSAEPDIPTITPVLAEVDNDPKSANPSADVMFVNPDRPGRPASVYEDDAIDEIHDDRSEAPQSTRGVTVIPVPYGNVRTEEANVVPLHRTRAVDEDDLSRLSKPEREAFRKIADALGARMEGDEDDVADLDTKPIEDTEEPVVEKVPEPDIEEIAKPAAIDRPEPDNKVVPLPSAFAPAGLRIDPRLIDRLPIGVLVCRGDTLLFANETILDLLGHATIEELRDAGGMDAVFADRDPIPGAPYTDAPSDHAVAALHHSGRAMPVQARMFRVPWNNDSALMISLNPEVSDSEDAIDEAAAAHTSRRAAEDRAAELDAILETATDGVVMLTGDGKILAVNGSAQALFDAGQDEMVGSNITEYLARESHRTALDYLDGLANNGVASLLNDGREVIGRTTNGGQLPMFMTIGRVGEDEAAKFCAVLRDITQWKKAEEDLTSAKRQAENASTQKSDFLARISHEIRTPLNAIIGFSEVMMDERFGEIGNPRYKEYLQDIHTSGAHIMSLINDLLDLSKIEAGKMELTFEAVALSDLVAECVGMVEPQANQERVIIRSSLSESVPNVVADARSVRQIVLNLLSNAIKFNVQGGQVIISTSLEENGEVVIRVRDTGVGMSEKDITTALEPFRQLHTARSGVTGSGLGLPLTKALTEANRATFTIESNVNQGTIVSVVFPSTRVLAE